MSQRLPTLRRHRAKARSDRAYVTVRERRRYLGPYGSEEARVAYAEVISRIAKGDDPFDAIFPPSDELLPEEEREKLAVAGLLSRFLVYARQHYRRRDGTPTGTAEAFRHAMKSLLTLYGGVPAESFDSLAVMDARRRSRDRPTSSSNASRSPSSRARSRRDCLRASGSMSICMSPFIREVPEGFAVRPPGKRRSLPGHCSAGVYGKERPRSPSRDIGGARMTVKRRTSPVRSAFFLGARSPRGSPRPSLRKRCEKQHG